MDLWVRSQDREYLEKIEKIYYWERSPENYVIEGKGELGTYKTEKRALEVLDEIQNIIRGKYATSFNYMQAFKGFKKEDTQYMLEQMAVYEMPEE